MCGHPPFTVQAAPPGTPDQTHRWRGAIAPLQQVQRRDKQAVRPDANDVEHDRLEHDADDLKERDRQVRGAP